MVVVDVLRFEVDELAHVQEDHHHQGQRGYVAKVAHSQDEDERFGSLDQRVSHSVVRRGQFVLRDFQEVDVLEVVEELGVFAFVVLLEGVEGNEGWPGEGADEGENANDGVDGLAAVAVVGVAEVVELNHTGPYSSQKLIAPDLIGKVDGPSSHIVQKPMKNSLLLLDQVPVDSFAGEEDDQEPNEVDDVDNDDGEELSQEIDVGVEEIKPDGTVLDDVAHPLMLDGLAVRRNQEVQVLDEVKPANSVSEGQRNVVSRDVDVQEKDL